MDHEVILKARQECDDIDEERIEKAIEWCKEKHEGQQRKSTGAPYHTHPMQVALNVTDWICDTETTCAALLHDLVEDTDTELEEIEKEFGEEITFLVDGMTEDKSIDDKEKRKKEYFKKIKKYGKEDERIYYIKFADLLHNIKTIKVKGIENAKKYIEDVKEVYVPIAQELGEEKIASELEEWCDKALKIKLM